MPKDQVDSRLTLRRRARMIGWITLSLLAAVAIADRAGGFGYGGNDHRAFDHRSASVLDTIDGDTIRVTRETGSGVTESIEVRLLGVDAPDLPEAHWAQPARTYTTNRLRGRTVTLRLDPVQTRSPDGRLLAFVYVTPADCLNVDIVRDGHAYADRRIRCSLRSLIEPAEAEARRKRRGLWRDGTDDQQPQWRRGWLQSR